VWQLASPLGKALQMQSPKAQAQLAEIRETANVAQNDS
jgi:hypothetical protein